MAEALGVDPDELSVLQSEARQELARGTVPNAALASRGMAHAPRRGSIPVIGRACASGKPGKLIMLNEITEYISTPPELDGVTDAFAVYVYGDSMVPRYFPNEKVYVHPYRQVNKGDFCVVQIGSPTAECAYVKRFVSLDGDELVLEQYNPPIQLRFSADDVFSIGLVVGSGRA